MAKMSRLSKALREIIVDLGQVQDVSKTLKEFDALQKPKRKVKRTKPKCARATFK